MNSIVVNFLFAVVMFALLNGAVSDEEDYLYVPQLLDFKTETWRNEMTRTPNTQEQEDNHLKRPADHSHKTITNSCTIGASVPEGKKCRSLPKRVSSGNERDPSYFPFDAVLVRGPLAVRLAQNRLQTDNEK